MGYFSNFKPIPYQFGNEENYAATQNLAQYVDIIDQVKNKEVFLQDYTIPANERPDQTAFKMYGNADYYWTLFLVNDHIRERGWPLTLNEVDEAAKLRYPHRTITVKLQQPDVIDYYERVSGSLELEPIFRTKIVGSAPDQFAVGSQLTGSQSGTFGTIVSRDLSLGTFVVDTTAAVQRNFVEEQTVVPNSNGILEIERTDSLNAETYTNPLLWVLRKDDVVQSGYRIELNSFKRKATIQDIVFDPTSTYTLSYYYNKTNTTDGKFIVGEEVSYINPAGTETSMIVFDESEQYNGVHHYEDEDGNWVDINPIDQNKNGATEVSWLEYLRAENESLRQIKFIKPESITGIVNEFNTLMSE